MGDTGGAVKQRVDCRFETVSLKTGSILSSEVSVSVPSTVDPHDGRSGLIGE
jgi:hypothetical protein